MSLPGTSLKAAGEARARRAAFDILVRVEAGGAWAEPLLDRRERDLAGTPEAGLLHELVLGVLRQRRVLDHVLERASSRPVSRMDRPVRNALRIGAYSLLFLDRVPAFAAVATAVDLTRYGGADGATGFVNAVLRRVARERDRLLPPAPERGDVEGLALRYSHPTWWVARLVDRVGWEAALARLEANNRPAPTVLRPNLLRTTPEELSRRLLAEGVRTEPGLVLPGALRVVSGLAQRSRAFREGLFWIQDEGSQLVSELFGASPGRRLADLCAAPGTKTLALAERAPEDGVVIASDRHERRLRRLAAGLARLGFGRRVLPVVADAAGRAPFRGGFDAVLVDAPCSGTGTLGRRPEIRWRIAPEHLAPLAARQESILETAARLVRPAGEIVYAVCSLEPEEGPDLLRRFLERHRGFEIRDPAQRLPGAARDLVAADGSLNTAAAAGLDGFYAVVLVRERRVGEP